MKTNLTTTKIPLSGKNAYPQLLIKNHTKMLNSFMVKLGVSPQGKRAIRALYKKHINLENITKVYQHSMRTFIDYLIDNKIEDLYKFSEAEFRTIKKS